MEHDKKAKLRANTAETGHEAAREEFGKGVWEELVEETCEELDVDWEKMEKLKWQPLEFSMVFIKLLHERFSERDSDYSMMFEFGCKHAEKSLSTTTRFLSRILSVENLMKRANIAWSQYFTRGYLSFDQEGGSYLIKVKDIEIMHPYDYYLCGFFFQAGIILGLEVSSARHAHFTWEEGEASLTEEKLTECIAEGDEESVFVLKA